MEKFDKTTLLKGYSLVEHNNIFVMLDENLISIIDAHTKNIIANISSLRHASHIKFSPDDKIMAIKTTNGSIGLFSLQDISLNKVIKYNREGPDMVFTNDSKYILDGDWDGNIRKINTENGEINLIKSNIECKIQKLLYNSDTNEYILFIYIRRDKTQFNCSKGLYVLKLDFYKNQYFVNEGFKILNNLGDAIYCSSLKQFIAVEMSNIYFIDSNNFNITKTLFTGLSTVGLDIIRISKCEKYFLAASIYDIYLYETNSFRKIKTFKKLGFIIDVEFSLNESQIFVGTSEGIKIMDIQWWNKSV